MLDIEITNVRDDGERLLEAIDTIAEFCRDHIECKTCELRPLCGELNNCVKCFCYAANQANRDNQLKKNLEVYPYQKRSLTFHRN